MTTTSSPDTYAAAPIATEPPVGTVLRDRDGYVWQRCGTDTESGVDLPARARGRGTAGWVGSRSSLPRKWSSVLIDHGPLTRMVPAEPVSEEWAARALTLTATHLMTAARPSDLGGVPDTVATVLLDLQAAHTVLHDVRDALARAGLGRPPDDQVAGEVESLADLAESRRIDPAPDLVAERDRLRRVIASHRGTYSVCAAAERCLDSDSVGAEHRRHLDRLRNALDQTRETVESGYPADDLDRLRTVVGDVLASAEGDPAHRPGVRAPVHAYTRGLAELGKRCVEIRTAAMGSNASEPPRLSVTAQAITRRVAELEAMTAAAVQRASEAARGMPRGPVPKRPTVGAARTVEIQPDKVLVDGVEYRSTDAVPPAQTVPGGEIGQTFTFTRDPETYRSTDTTEENRS